MIDAYEFGTITINGTNYTSDVIIYPDGINNSWWRKEGHRLQIQDVTEIIEQKPDILIVGTGYNGFMKVSPEVTKYLESEHIQLIAESTQKACRTYNELCLTKRVIAALHLTC